MRRLRRKMRAAAQERAVGAQGGEDAGPRRALHRARFGCSRPDDPVLGLLGIFIGLFAAIPWKAAVLVAIAVTAGFWALLAKGVAQMVRDVHAIRARMEK